MKQADDFYQALCENARENEQLKIKCSELLRALEETLGRAISWYDNSGGDPEQLDWVIRTRAIIHQTEERTWLYAAGKSPGDPSFDGAEESLT